MNFFKNPRFVYGAMSVALALSLFGSATFAQASTLTPVQVEAITNLLQSFGVDSGTIANVQAVLENQSTTTQAASLSNKHDFSEDSDQPQSGNGCNVLDDNLQLGATDQSTKGNVSQLQTFLGKNKDIYPENAVTGYYGNLTLQAVQRWQAAHGIVSSGDPESTGFGYIGPRTRKEIDKEMETECEREDSQNSSPENSGKHFDNSATSTRHSSDPGDN